MKVEFKVQSSRFKVVFECGLKLRDFGHWTNLEL